MILLDTNVISEPWKPVPHGAVVAWMDAQVIETLFLSAITIAELRFAIAAMALGKRQTVLRDHLEGEVLPSCCPVDVGDALAGSGLVSHRALLHRDGTPVRRYAWQARRRDDDQSQQRLERSVVVINSSLNTTCRAGYSFSKKRKVQAALPTDYEDHLCSAGLIMPPCRRPPKRPWMSLRRL